MTISPATFCSLILVAAAAGADTLSDLKAVVEPLRGAAPIHATVEIRRTRKSEGRFANQASNGSVTVDVSSDAAGLHLTYAPALLERAEREAREHQADPKKPTPIRGVIADIDANGMAENLDFRAPLLRLLGVARAISETRVMYHGTPARLLVLKLTPHLPREATTIWHVNFSEDRLNVWIGADGVPIAAERSRKGSAGFLFLRGEMTSRESWSFARAQDRLVVMRYESSFVGSGFGQRGEGRDVQTVTLY
jgi:hypothetical protein